LKRLRYIPQLDSFRFFSVFAVMMHHWLPNVALFHNGGAGVTFFFVLSGYLISSNLLYLKKAVEAGQTPLRFAFLKFYYRRTLRIFPLYYLVIFSLLLIVPAAFAGKFVWYALYISNFLIFHHQAWPDMLSHFWSLAVEEQFYLIWPFLIFFVRWRQLPKLFIATICISILFQAYFIYITPNQFFGVLPLSQFDTFGMGALLAYLPFSNWRLSWLEKKPVVISLFVGSMLLTILILNISWPSAFFNLSFSVAVLLVIHQAQKGIKGVIGWILNLPMLIYLGRISYGLYVYHMFMPWLWCCLTGRETRYSLPIALFTKPWMSRNMVNLAAQFILVVGIASLSWFLFEKPINGFNQIQRFENESGKP
jgi:peptidoglycan/LPS O-acetylase OafA/YrhL